MSQAYTAKEARVLADAQITTWKGAPDAYLCQVLSSQGLEDDAQPGEVDRNTGISKSWWLDYYSPTLKKYFRVEVYPKKVKRREFHSKHKRIYCNYCSDPPAPLPSTWLNSPDVLSIAERQGGSELSKAEKVTPFIILRLPAAGDPDAKNIPPELCWEVVYDNEIVEDTRRGMVMKRVWFYVAAESGELLGTEETQYTVEPGG